MMYSCNVFGISRQAYYKQKNRCALLQEQSEAIIRQVQQHRSCMPRIGTRKLYYLLGNDLPIGRDKLFKLLKANNLLIKHKKSYTKTTMSKHWLRKYPNLLPDLKITRPEHENT